MDKVKCIIVDDEQSAINTLTRLVRQVPELDLIATFTDPVKALAFIRNNEVYLVFLDINMETLSGLDFAGIVKNKIIFTTGHEEFAFASYEFDNVLHYLSKPIFFERFMKAVTKAMTQFAVDNMIPQAFLEDFLTFKHKGVALKLHYDKIEYIQAIGNYSSVYYEGKRIVAPFSIWDLESLLPTDKFSRIHKSYIANEKKILDWSSKEVILVGGQKIPYGKKFQKKLDEMKIK